MQSFQEHFFQTKRSVVAQVNEFTSDLECYNLLNHSTDTRVAVYTVLQPIKIFKSTQSQKYLSGDVMLKKVLLKA